MHSVCLGAIRKLLNIWLRGPLEFRLPTSIVNRMSDCLTSLRDPIPIEFARKPRTLRELDRWKATEFRMFLLFTGPVILSSYVDTNIYNNFMLLFSGIAILVSPTLSSLHWQYSETLLQMFATSRVRCSFISSSCSGCKAAWLSRQLCREPPSNA